MSWEAIIDQMKEWVQAQGYLTTSYINQGDPLIPHFITPGFIRDGAWHDMDLSFYVPANVVAVHLGVLVKASAINISIRFRKNGNVNTANIALFTTQVANLNLSGDCTVTIDTNRVIEYFAPVQVTALDVVIRGWWL